MDSTSCSCRCFLFPFAIDELGSLGVDFGELQYCFASLQTEVVSQVFTRKITNLIFEHIM